MLFPSAQPPFLQPAYFSSFPLLQNRALVGEAHLAGLYRDELDALREKTLRMERLQAELGALRELLPALEQCRAQLKEEREFSQAVLETKALLEEQLEAARARGQRLNQLEKDKLLLQSSLHQAQEEREQLFHQTEELLRENLGLERRLRQSLGEPLDALRAEELEFDWAPSEPSAVPVLLSCEGNETGRLLALERENQGLRRRLQEALEEAANLGGPGSEEETHLHREPAWLQNQAEEPKLERLSEVRKAEATEREETAGSGPERKDSRAHEEEAEAVAGLEVALAEAEREREAESCRVAALEERLRSLQDALADALAEREQERARRLSESERLLEEVQALEREREASQAGAEALRAAATQAERKLAEAQESLQGEQRQGARLSRKAQQAEEDLREARRELEGLERSLERHKVALARLEAEKGALEEALRQAEAQRRALDRAGRRLKAQAQAQEEALAAQGQRLAHLEAQSRQQAAELSALADVSQRLGELEQESARLRGQLGAQRETSAALEEELQKEKTREKEREAVLVLLKEQLLNKEESLQEAIRSQQKYSCTQSQELQEEHSSGRMSELEEENSALKRQIEELHALNRQLTHDLHQNLNLLLSVPCQAKSLLVLPPSPEEKSLVSSRSEGQGNPDLHLLPLQANMRNEALSARLLEVECRNAALQAEKLALSEHLGQLKSQVGSLQAVLQDQQGQLSQAKEESGKWQAQNSSLQAEAAALRSQQALLESQVSRQGQRLGALEAELRGAQKDREEWRGRHEALLRDHDCLMVLHDRQGSDLEGLRAKHTSLKGALRCLEQEHHELQGRHSQLLGQKAGLEEREAVLQKQKEQLEEAERHHRTLTEQHGQLKEEHERVKQMLLQADRARDDLQRELHSSRNRLTGLQLEQARLEAENVALKEQNQQLDSALGRLGTQCELLAQLKGNQEEENRHLLEEIQVLSRENRRLLERSMESREHFQEEQRQYLDKLGELRREKQKLVEKIMDQYRVLDPALPRSKSVDRPSANNLEEDKDISLGVGELFWEGDGNFDRDVAPVEGKSSWIAEKIRKLMKPRREAPREQLRPMAEGAGSSESLMGPEGGRATDGAVSSAPGSPASLRKASSVFSIPDTQQVNFRRHRLSSRMPAADGDGSDTPRQRFRQRRLGMLGGSREEAIVSEAAAEWDGPSQGSRSSQEERGKAGGRAGSRGPESQVFS
ncbi:hypothetical protein lerEdw1_007316 [Lerista edwardsae]|nr:hypothetical protein lerEdw1_007316 [Lerista edwardsae]